MEVSLSLSPSTKRIPAMNKASLLISLAMLCTFTAAQAEKPSHPNRTSIRYHESRQAMTAPSYSLPRVRALIRRIKEDSEGNARLSSKSFNGLSLQEKFTYVMIHAEDSSQNCDVMPGIVHEERRIFAFTPAPFDDQAVWSKRQTAFLANNRARVIGLMRETIRAKGRVGSNFKRAILELNAVELIPHLVGVYNRTRADHDILTVVMILMKDGKYQPFLASSIHKRLFGENTSFQASLPASPANQRFVTDQAMRFYKSSRK